MSNYNHKEIEIKWQKKWEEWDLYKTGADDDKPKYYALDMFPYPSGEGLHVGHPKGYIATDVMSRFKILNGYSVLHPMGWDAFGLPAENYAIKNKIHPRIAVEKNVARFKEQLQMFGCTYDWDREINTTDPEYYKWTQWIFLKLFENGLAYESNEPVNWCPSCKTVLANEDLEDGKCERCSSSIEQRPLRQWVLKMTAYADRLLYDLDKPEVEWEEMIKEQQRNWIGRSEGTEIDFRIQNSELRIKVFTTRVDTIFGCTYCVVAPEHPLIANLKLQIENLGEVEDYVNKAKNKTELDRMEQKEKTGVEIKGIKAINPFTDEEVPVFVADYVLGNYGTGAVMAVPAHDERDWDFAKKYALNIKKSIDDKNFIDGQVFTGDGALVNSGDFTGLSSVEAREKMAAWLEENGFGSKKVNYKMRDWVFSRQRYWGEPIPVVHCEQCGVVGVPESELPLRLPEVEHYEPTGTGEGPLAAISDWVNTTCPKCGGAAKRETNTMPQWAGSSWYYLRYIDPNNNESLIGKEEEKRWMPVDLYVGGIEHTTRHLLYARFWHKFLFDIGAVSTSEPFKRLIHVGLINAEDGRKMSKRWGNVINPDDVIRDYGADAMRMYEMFMGPFTQTTAWNMKGVVGTKRFLDKVYDYFNFYVDVKTKYPHGTFGGARKKNILHKTIKKVGEDIENFRFNTAISQLMILFNELKDESIFAFFDESYEMDNILIMLSPFAPHLAEELWAQLGHTESIFKARWPKFNPDLIKDDMINLVIQINGKLRDTIEVATDITEDEAKKIALESDVIKKWIDGKEIMKVVFVKGKLVNIVVK